MSTEISIRIESDGSAATLTIPADFDPEMLTQDTLLAVASDAGVLIGERVERAISEFIAGQTPTDTPTDDSAEEPVDQTPTELLIATSVLPEHGEDGWIEWAKGFDPNDTGPAPTEDEQADYYHGLEYVRVTSGNLLGQMIMPTFGTDGIDVRGKTIKAHPGKTCPVKLHSSVRIDAENKLIADGEGVLILQRELLEVSQQLDIRDCVDFATGNIDFSGTVNIGDAIRSGFTVKADADVQVGGLIEDAKIICGGNMVARRGMAGKMKGRIEVGGNIGATYLEEVLGTVEGDLEVRSGVIGCELTVGGNVECASGVIRGGSIQVTGVLKVKVLGSEAHTPTTVYLGDVPLLRTTLEEAEAKAAAAKLAVTKLTTEDHQTRLVPNPTNEQKERLTELMFEIEETNEELARVEEQSVQVRQTIEATRILDAQIGGQIYAGVTLIIGNQRATFRETTNGPISIFWNDARELLYRSGSGESHALSTIARIGKISKPESKIAA
ncbi:MAG: hypothetical protein ACI89L_000504 [Phycisphaerales bacterium]